MIILGILGQLVGLLIFVWIIKSILDQRKCHPEVFELMEDEEIVEIVKGDYWVREFLIQQTQNHGEFAFTNKRVMFKGTFLLSSHIAISIPYNEILSIKKSFVGLFFPVAFTIETMEGKSYKFAMMKRQKYIDLINSLAKQG